MLYQLREVNEMHCEFHYKLWIRKTFQELKNRLGHFELGIMKMTWNCDKKKQPLIEYTLRVHRKCNYRFKEKYKICSLQNAQKWFVIAKSMRSIDTETESMVLKLFILILYKYVISNYEMPSVRNYFIKRKKERKWTFIDDLLLLT